ncbi:MAG: carboxypeptidase regulatory-like domain-containing protein, partial [Paraglaciecola sp.]|nr:carboxypeptidase regulatory-like domain-containing protein [Paraglaciecola sp.]
MKNKLFRHSLTAMAVIASMGLATPVFADNTTSNIVGQISASDYSQYKIVLKDPKTGLTREIQLSDSGSFRFAQLPTGEYDIQVSKNGVVVAEEKTRLSLGSNSTLDFDFLAADGTERIEV